MKIKVNTIISLLLKSLKIIDLIIHIKKMMVIIENLYKMLNTHTNWAYWQIRDSRTVFSMMEVDPRKGIQEDLHSAVDDAKWQAKCLQTCFFMLDIKKS